MWATYYGGPPFRCLKNVTYKEIRYGKLADISKEDTKTPSEFP